MLWSWRSGVSLIDDPSRARRTWWRRPEGRLHHLTANALAAVLLVLTDADLAPLQPALLEELLVVVLRDPLHREDDRRLLLPLDHPEAVRLRRLSVEQRDRGGGHGVRLERHVLVDRARLPPREDVLDTLRRRVLAGQRDLLQVLSLQIGDHCARDVVVRRDDALDVVAGRDEHLLE